MNKGSLHAVRCAQTADAAGLSFLGGRVMNDDPDRDVPHPLTAQPRPEPHLTLVPDLGKGADRRDVVARWVITLTEPLLSAEHRVRSEDEMARFIDRNIDWACAYLSGLLTDLVATLPPDDPWRHLAGMIDLTQVATGHLSNDPSQRLGWPNEPIDSPAATGALTRSGRAFGTPADSADLLASDVSNSELHPQTAAVATNLSPLGAAFVAFASADATTFQSVLTKVYHSLWLARYGGLTTESPGTSMLKTVGQALRWTVHRRRVYTVDDDGFTNVLGLAWISKADRVVAGVPISKEARATREGEMEPRLYHDLSMTDDGDDI